MSYIVVLARGDDLLAQAVYNKRPNHGAIDLTKQDNSLLSWLWEWSDYIDVGVGVGVPPLLFSLPVELYQAVTDNLEVLDLIALSRTCRSGSHASLCRCCLEHVCKYEVLDYMWVGEMQKEMDLDYDYHWGNWQEEDYDIDWEAE